MTEFSGKELFNEEFLPLPGNYVVHKSPDMLAVYGLGLVWALYSAERLEVQFRIPGTLELLTYMVPVEMLRWPTGEEMDELRQSYIDEEALLALSNIGEKQ